LAFNQHDLQRAVRQYVGKEYLQHNPMVADGGQAFIDTFAPFLKQNPQSRASVRETPYWDWIASSVRLCPGAISPATMARPRESRTSRRRSVGGIGGLSEGGARCLLEMLSDPFKSTTFEVDLSY